MSQLKLKKFLYKITNMTPIGTIQGYAGEFPPTDWLICDGSAVSRTTYSALFQVIKTVYGAGDGSTTFNLPDLRGRTPIGAGIGTSSDAIMRTIGAAGGSERVTLTSGQLPSHTHGSETLSGTVLLRKWGTGFLAQSASGIISSAADSTNKLNNFTAGNSSQDSQKITINATHEHDSVGNNESHGNMPPYLTINYIIYAGV